VAALLNLPWVLFGGFWMALSCASAVVIMAIAIAGIPFTWAHLKVTGIAPGPIGKIIVRAE
jgi:uncharacterized membrane protein YccF (DUF307 family)